jgi:hypothetical protein
LELWLPRLNATRAALVNSRHHRSVIVVGALLN